MGGLQLAPRFCRRSGPFRRDTLSVSFHVLCHGVEESPRLSAVTEVAAATSALMRRWRRHAKARLQGQGIAGHPARWPVRRLWLGARARLVFQRPCTRSDAADLLAAAAMDLAACLRGTAVQDRDPAGNPGVKFDIPGHFCRHRWRLHTGIQTAFLTLSTNRRVEGRTFPYVWVQAGPHLALCVARLFRPL